LGTNEKKSLVEEKIEELRLILNNLPGSSFSSGKMLELSRQLDQHIADYQRFQWDEKKK